MRDDVAVIGPTNAASSRSRRPTIDPARFCVAGQCVDVVKQRHRVKEDRFANECARGARELARILRQPFTHDLQHRAVELARSAVDQRAPSRTFRAGQHDRGDGAAAFRGGERVAISSVVSRLIASGMSRAIVRRNDCISVRLQEQHAIANERAGEKGLNDRARFRLQDYRDVAGRSTASCRSACSSMSASVTTTRSSKNARELLDDDGVMVLHSIGRSEGPERHQSRGSRNIFSPAATSLRCPRSCRRSNSAGLLVTDIEILRLHYAETLKAWRERFLAHREEAERIYDQRFVRMWEFYLARPRCRSASRT